MNAFLKSLIMPASPIKIIDLGAARFESTHERYQNLASSWPTSIIGFEPNAAEYEKLIARFGSDPGRSYLPRAVADGGVHELKICNLPGCSSLFEPHVALASAYQSFGEWMHVVDRQRVETCRLDDIEVARNADLIKLDIQGAEYLVLENAPHTLSRALVVECEVEFVEQYVGQPMFSEIELLLRRSGLKFHRFLGYGSRMLKPLCRDNDTLNPGSQWLWSDAVFIRDPETWNNLSTEALLKVAVILGEAYGSVDFAFRALSLADAKMGTDCADRYLDNLRSSGIVMAPAPPASISDCKET